MVLELSVHRKSSKRYKAGQLPVKAEGALSLCSVYFIIWTFLLPQENRIFRREMINMVLYCWKNKQTHPLTDKAFQLGRIQEMDWLTYIYVFIYTYVNKQHPQWLLQRERQHVLGKKRKQISHWAFLLHPGDPDTFKWTWLKKQPRGEGVYLAHSSSRGRDWGCWSHCS